MKNKFLAILIALAVIFQVANLPTISAMGGDPPPPPNQDQQDPVQISHNVPTEVLLTDIPFVPDFYMEIPDGGNGDIAYYVVQASESKIEYLPNGITYQEVSIPVDLREKDTTVLVAAANSSGDITRIQVKVILNMDCPGCDLSWYGPNNSGKYMGMDFCGADLSYAKMRNLHLQGTSFCGANLMGIDFSSDFEVVPRVYTVLHRAQFVGADLRDALFTNTYLIEIDFTDADLTGADLTSSPEIKRCVWDNTTCPDGTNSDDNGGSCLGHLTP